MDLTPSDRATIVMTLARALPSWEDRAEVAGASGLSDVQLAGAPDVAWGILVGEASHRGRLPALTAAACRRAPSSGPLRRLHEAVIAGRRPPGAGRTWVAIGSVAAVIAALVVARVVASDPDETRHTATALPQAALPEAASAPAEAPRVAPDAAQPPADSEPLARPAAVEAAPEPVASPEVAEVAEVARQPAEPPPAAARTASSPCAGAHGWAWMGASTRLGAGDVWEIPGGANVRTEAPSLGNRWNARSPLVCFLPAGTRLRLISAPVVIPGGAVWAEVDGGSVLP